MAAVSEAIHDPQQQDQAERNPRQHQELTKSGGGHEYMAPLATKIGKIGRVQEKSARPEPEFALAPEAGFIFAQATTPAR